MGEGDGLSLEVEVRPFEFGDLGEPGAGKQVEPHDRDGERVDERSSVFRLGEMFRRRRGPVDLPERSPIVSASIRTRPSRSTSSATTKRSRAFSGYFFTREKGLRPSVGMPRSSARLRALDNMPRV
jgi:hypothetical protein